MKIAVAALFLGIVSVGCAPSAPRKQSETGIPISPTDAPAEQQRFRRQGSSFSVNVSPGSQVNPLGVTIRTPPGAAPVTENYFPPRQPSPLPTIRSGSETQSPTTSTHTAAPRQLLLPQMAASRLSSPVPRVQDNNADSTRVRILPCGDFWCSGCDKIFVNPHRDCQ